MRNRILSKDNSVVDKALDYAERILPGVSWKTVNNGIAGVTPLGTIKAYYARGVWNVSWEKRRWSTTDLVGTFEEIRNSFADKAAEIIKVFREETLFESAYRILPGIFWYEHRTERTHTVYGETSIGKVTISKSGAACLVNWEDAEVHASTAAGAMLAVRQRLLHKKYNLDLDLKRD